MMVSALCGLGWWCPPDSRVAEHGFHHTLVIFLLCNSAPKSTNDVSALAAEAHFYSFNIIYGHGKEQKNTH